MKEKLIQIKKKDFFLREQEEDGDNVKVDDTKNNASFQEMVSILLHSQTQVHIFHLQTKSYSEHKALQNYYEGIDGLVDGVIESYQGKYDVLTGYKSIKTEEYKSNEQIIKYFKSLDSMVEKNRKEIKESFIQNQIDTIQELIYSTLYKLRFLK
jgi:hypothetical protein